MAGALLIVAISMVLPLPAHACSCAAPTDIPAWVGESEAAFVGTLVERHDGVQGRFGAESIFVFEVEEWVKGDAGGVIEVRSASDGAACGFEFWDEDMRIGAILHEENGELHGSLCSQIDPDVLLAALREPTKSTTGIGHLLVGGGWSSPRLTVLDETGAHVTAVAPPGVSPDGGSGVLEACPGGRFAVQLTPLGVTVWDLETIGVATTHEAQINPEEWLAAVSCRSEDASEIWGVIQAEFSTMLVDLKSGDLLVDNLPGFTWKFGNGFVVTQNEGQDDPILTVLDTGEQVHLHQTPAGENWSINVAPHPTDQLVALVETRFSAGESPVEATLFILDTDGEVVEQFEIPYETYSPVWLDDERLAVNAYNFDDWEESYGLVFDLESGTTHEIEGWTPEYQVADGDLVFGTVGGEVLKAHLPTGDVETLVTMPTQSAGPLLLLDHSEPVTTSTSESDVVPPTTGATVPPLVAPELGSDAPDTGYFQWVAGLAIVVFLGVLVWLGARSPRRQDSDSI